MLFPPQMVKLYPPDDECLNGNMLDMVQHTWLSWLARHVMCFHCSHVSIAHICYLLRSDVTEGHTEECANSTWRDEYVR